MAAIPAQRLALPASAGIWQLENHQKSNPPLGPLTPTVRATPRTCPVQAVLGLGRQRTTNGSNHFNILF